jgi:hypothetical protein
MQHQYLSSMLHPIYIFKLSSCAYLIKKTELMEVGNREKKMVPFHHLPCPLITTYSKLIQLPNILLFNIIQANSRLFQASLHVMSKNYMHHESLSNVLHLSWLQKSNWNNWYAIPPFTQASIETSCSLQSCWH